MEIIGHQYRTGVWIDGKYASRRLQRETGMKYRLDRYGN